MEDNHPCSDQIEQLLTTVGKYCLAPEIGIIERAIEVAQAAHFDKRRLSGDPYIAHVLEVAQLLATWRAPVDVVTVAVLHDVLKGEPYSSPPTNTELETTFGRHVLKTVWHCERLSQFSGSSHGEMHNEDERERQLLGANVRLASKILAREPIAIVVKLIDRILAFRTLTALPSRARDMFVNNVLSLYIPFAERMGVYWIKRQLENGVFQLLQPERYLELETRYGESARRAASQALIKKIRQALGDLQVQIDCGPVSLYWLNRQEAAREGNPIDLSTVHQYVVTAPDHGTCYAALGLLHEAWRATSGATYDYISAPKHNGYRGLHTVLSVDRSAPVRIAIRTSEMNLLAEYGYLSRWFGVSESFVPEMPRWQEPAEGKIAVFTPQGDVFHLPRGATPVDFAYSLSANLGHRCIGARVNGQQVSLDSELKSDDIVYVLTSSAAEPSRDQLEKVKSKLAKNQIQRYLRQKEYVGNSQIPDSEVVFRASQNLVVLPPTIDHIPITFCRICSPKPPVSIVAKVIGDRKVTIHKSDCRRARHSDFLHHARWDTTRPHQVHHIEISSIDRSGLTRDIGDILMTHSINAVSVALHRMQDGSAIGMIVVHDLAADTLFHFVEALKAIPGVRVKMSREWEPPWMFPKGSYIRRHLENPYSSTRPAVGEGFFGRDLARRQLVDKLRYSAGGAVLLWGPRQIGKTSLLRHVEHVILTQEYLPVYVDMRDLGPSTSTSDFLFRITEHVVRALQDRQINVPGSKKFFNNPLMTFETFFEQLFQGRTIHLVLMLDEFERLYDLTENRVTRREIGAFFRRMLLMERNLSLVVSCGGLKRQLLDIERMGDLVEGLHELRIGVLDRSDAARLVEWRFPDVPEKVDQLLTLTGCHPLLLQVFLAKWFERTHRQGDWQPDAIVEQFGFTLQDWADMPEQHFRCFWGDAIGFSVRDLYLCKLALASIAQVTEVGQSVRFTDLTAILPSEMMDDADFVGAFADLVEIESLEGIRGEYRIKYPLVHHWFKANAAVPHLVGQLARLEG